MTEHQKASIQAVTPIRMDPDADEIAIRYAEMLGASKPKFVSNVMRALKDMVEGPGTSTLVKMLRSGHRSQPHLVFDKDEDVSPSQGKFSKEDYDVIKETMRQVVREEITQYSAPKQTRKRKTG